MFAYARGSAAHLPIHRRKDADFRFHDRRGGSRVPRGTRASRGGSDCRRRFHHGGRRRVALSHAPDLFPGEAPQRGCARSERDEQGQSDLSPWCFLFLFADLFIYFPVLAAYRAKKVRSSSVGVLDAARVCFCRWREVFG